MRVCCPESVLFGRRPEQTSGGLRVNRRKVCTEELGPQGQYKLRFHKRDVVIHKTGVQVIEPLGRRKHEARTGFKEAAIAETCAQSIAELVARAEAALFDEIDIARVAPFAEVHLIVIRAVVIHLELEIVAVPEFMRPP